MSHFLLFLDAVTFSKKMLSGGIYHKKTLRPAHPGRVVNTWVGDPHKALMLEAVSLLFNSKMIQEGTFKTIFRL